MTKTGNKVGNKVAVGVLALIAPLAVWLAHLTYGDTTPDPLPTHWGTHGVDGTTAATPYFVGCLVASAALAVAAVAALWWAHSAHAARMLTCLLVFCGWVAGAIYVESMILSRHSVDAYSVSMPWYVIVATVVVPALAGVTTWFLVPASHPAHQVSVTPTTLTLRPGERATWLGHAHSTPIRIGSAVGAGAAAVLVFFEPQVAIPVGIVAVALAWTSVLAVRVDEAGVHTLWGPFGWPHPVIALDRIASAHAQRIDPWKWGGWGYRVTGKGTAAVVRRGPGLVIERVTGPAYAVTVDGAAEAADLLNALLDRAHSG
ncbi:MAG: hypothetical protein ACRDQA_21465 [Nocardioidaceae bacterium]